MPTDSSKAVAASSHAPALRPWVTLGAALVLAGLLAAALVAQVTLEPLQTLRYPAESAGRVSDRHLAFYEGYESVPAWQRLVYRWLFGPRAGVENTAVETYREILDHFEAYPGESTPWAVQNTRSRLLVTLGEIRPWHELEKELDRLGDNPEQVALKAAIRYAYGERPKPTAPPEINIGQNLFPRGWAADRIRLRVAERTGNTGEATYRGTRLREQGKRLRDRTLMLTSVVAVLLVSGVAVLLIPGQRPARPAAWQGDILTRPWSLGDGLAVGVRAGVLGIAVVAGLASITGPYFRPGVLTLWGSLFAGLPMLWLIHRHLLRPRGLGFVQAYGLTFTGVRLGGFLRMVLAILALEWAGSLLIAWSSWKLSLGSHWSDGLHDRLIFGPWETTVFSAIDTVAFGPVMEEIAFRGLLYVALRSRFRPVPAALISACVFSALHLYSLPGSLAVFWSGLVFALALERFRSLLPVIAAHAGSNALSLSTVLLFYR